MSRWSNIVNMSQAERGATNVTGDAYRYRHVTLRIIMDDLDFERKAPRPDDPLPAFELPTASGGRINSGTVLANRPLLIVAASLTCPMAAEAHRMMKRLYWRFGDQIEFVTLYVREAHPGEKFEQATTSDQKLHYARVLQKRDRLPWTVAVDGVEGEVHRSLSERPNMAYIADRGGRILFRSLCAGDEVGMAKAVESVARGQRPRISESRRRLGPMADGIGNMRAMTRLAGPRAEWDIWRALPPVAALAWAADFFGPLSPRWRVAAALGTLGLIAGFSTAWAGGRPRALAGGIPTGDDLGTTART